jgi:dihydrofolate reductase
LRLTEVARAWPEADTFFPSVDKQVFEEVQRTEAQAVDGTAMAFVTYRRRAAAAA